MDSLGAKIHLEDTQHHWILSKRTNGGEKYHGTPLQKTQQLWNWKRSEESPPSHLNRSPAPRSVLFRRFSAQAAGQLDQVPFDGQPRTGMEMDSDGF